MPAKRSSPSNPEQAAEDPQEVEAEGVGKVGYGRPPIGTRFKPGESGNPRGRPRGSRSIDQVLRQALERRVPDPRGGRRTVRMLDVIIDGLVLGAARRDARMLRLLLTLIERYGSGDTGAIDAQQLAAADREILAEFAASIAATLSREDSGT